MNDAMGDHNSEITVEYGVPIPELAGRGRWIELLDEMDVAASFVASAAETSSFQKAARKKGYKVTVRMTNENHARPFRVWLVEKKEKANE